VVRATAEYVRWWQELTTGWQNPNMFPICQWTILGANTVASACIMSVTLSVAETKVLLGASCHHTQINDVLLTALVQDLHSGQESAHCSLT